MRIGEARLRGQPLTPTELRVLALASEGLRGREIAVANVIAHETVKSQIQSVLRKLGARSTTHAVALAVGSGLIPPPKPVE